MKTHLRYGIALILFFALAFAAFALRCSADEAAPLYYLDGDFGAFSLCRAAPDGEIPIAQTADLTSALSYLSPGSSLVFRSVRGGELSVDRDLTLSGSLTLTGSLTVERGKVCLSGLTLDSGGLALRVKSGEVILQGSRVRGERGGALLDYSAQASLALQSGSLVSSGEEPALSLSLGTAKISGGEVISDYGAAVCSSSTLMLSGAPHIGGVGYDVVTSRPIALSADGTPYAGEERLRVRYLAEFAQGSLTPVFRSAAPGGQNIALYDERGESFALTFFASADGVDEKDFLAVSRPFMLRVYDRTGLIAESGFYAGCPLPLPDPPGKEGYAFEGYSDAEGARVIAGDTASSDLDLTVSYRLLPPAFSLSSLAFSYDGESRNLAFTELSHPLYGAGKPGVFSFVWYRGNAPVSSARSCPVRSVSDSGEYFCRLTFSANGDTVEVETPKVFVEISRSAVKFPAISEKEYHSFPQSPDLSPSVLYTADLPSGTHAGEYPVTLTLTDPENFVWENGSSSPVILPFFIRKAENRLTEPIRVAAVYLTDRLSPSAALRFGTPTFTYSSSLSGVFSVSPPSSPGLCYVRAECGGSDDVLPFLSEPVAFSLRADPPAGVRLLSLPEKTSYFAKETFDLSGAIAEVCYESGRSAPLPSAALEIVYPNGDRLHFGDLSVLLSYAGFSVPVPVTVERVAPDLSAIVFADGETVYDGEFHTLAYSGELPSALRASVSGGGSRAGEYAVRLVFSSDDPDILVPPAGQARLTILPRPVEAVYSDTELVYSGEAQAPTASFETVSGARRSLTVSGGRIDAGENYLASVCSPDGDYTIGNPTCLFSIAKAALDLSGVIWSPSDLVYNGEIQAVSLSGLPEGVTLLGYTDAAFTDAGDYLAVAKLSFDRRNFIGEETISHPFRIRRAQYDLSSFSFSDESATYDGEAHYPAFSGSLPVGADGVPLTFSFSVGVIHAARSVPVTVSFSSESKNYEIPQPLTRLVTVSPARVRLSWSGETFVYDGSAHCPTASCPVSSVTVTGGAVGAGEYFAAAVLTSPDYLPENPSFRFTVGKAENRFLSLPTDLTVYESKVALPTVRTLYGSPSAAFFTDERGASPCPAPTSPGVYYYRFSVAGDENILPVATGLYRLEILPVLPLSLSVVLLREEFPACALPDAPDFTATLLLTDGSERQLPIGEIVCDLPHFGDVALTFRACGLAVAVPAKIVRASYPTERTHWENTDFVYDGCAHSPSLVSLPEGITLLSVTSATEAGSYPVEFVLDYDRENYLPPEIPPCTLTIGKRTIPIPDLSGFTYRGRDFTPSLPQDPAYTAEFPLVTAPGDYRVLLRLTDPGNTAFAGAQSAELSLTFHVPRETGGAYLLLLILAAVLFLLMLFILIFRRPRPRFFLLAAGSDPVRKGGRGALPGAPEQMLPDAAADLPAQSPDRSVAPLYNILSVDPDRADRMISDSLAKNLLEKRDLVVYTSGRRRAIVNVDTLSEHFCAGDRVDINLLKERGLIPTDAGKLKVLARGVIDKPLTVLADSFTPCAVKMIALTGGRCTVAKTVPIKKYRG